jgi:hypothetical protein
MATDDLFNRVQEPDDSGDTAYVIPLNSSGTDGKPHRFVVRDERGTALINVDASDGIIKLNGSAVAVTSVLTETHAASTFTDGGGAVGTKTMTGSIPAGAILLGSKVIVAAGFAGDVSCALTIGDGSDVDRYMTGTPSVFATASTGIQTGAPSGDKLVTTANQPVLTITSDADITPVIADAGSLTVSLFYIATV